MTIAVYWPAIRGDFVNYDDPDYVTANPCVQNGLTLEDIKCAFLNPVASNWHPLTILSHMLDCQCFGMNPMGHHLTSLLLHACNAALGFVWLRLLTGATWRSLLVAALFAVHPLRVESVAWVSERKDVLSGCFGLLTLIFYTRYARMEEAIESRGASAQGIPSTGTWSPTRDYMSALLFFGLGLMSKAMLVTWPFVMLLLDYWPMSRYRHGNAWQLVREKAPFFVLAAAGCLVTLAVQHHAGAVAAFHNLSPLARCENALVSYCRYLGKMIWPTNLAVFYPHPGNWPPKQVLVAGLLLAGISALLLVKRRKYPFLLMGWLWYVGTLIPVIGLVQVGDQSIADRYTYLPSLGLLIMVVWGLNELARQWRMPAIALSLAGAAAIFPCLLETRQQLGYWQDSKTLFQHALDVTANNHIAQNNMGAVLEAEGRIDEAITHYQEAIRLRPDDAPARYNLGNAFMKQGRLDEAIGQYQEAVSLDPANTDVLKNLGNAFYKSGRLDEAISQYQKGIRLNPDDATLHYNLGKVFEKQGQTDEAISQFREAVRLAPDYAEAHNNLGWSLQAKGLIVEAINQYEEAVRLKPDYELAQKNLESALEMSDASKAH
jgi:Flp pilus assembly protein TadD